MAIEDTNTSDRKKPCYTSHILFLIEILFITEIFEIPRLSMSRAPEL